MRPYHWPVGAMDWYPAAVKAAATAVPPARLRAWEDSKRLQIQIGEVS